ncbi:MAG TPA: Ig-like domain-containing protein [Vicinamibacteria bacterium]|nr:Ig-like domain-containing protein [Vicinamibacteria bacterium]
MNRILIAFAVLSMAGTAAAQFDDGAAQSQYDVMYGKPIDVTLSDLAMNPEMYESRAVRTHGRLERSFDNRDLYYLRDLNAAVTLVPVQDIRAPFETEARTWMGLEIEVTGVVAARTQSGTGLGADQPPVVITFWKYLGPESKESKGKQAPATELTLESLVSQPGKRDGQTVRVTGLFRGRNLYGDLPSRSERDSDDWVIKDDLYAVWVSGKKPKGSGWSLDAGLKRDTGKWIEVVGRPVTVNGITYIRALEIKLTGPPSATAQAAPPPPPPERPKVAPVVVFALPLDGESEVARDTRFVVQFSKDMDEATFAGHVLLRYAGPVLPGDRPFDGARLTYDEGRRALTVDPGDILRPGRQIELILLPGIVDIDGLPLIGRKGPVANNDVVDVLRYLVGI